MVLGSSCNGRSVGLVIQIGNVMGSEQCGVSTANVSVKVAPTVAGEVAVWTGVRAVTRVGQHVAVKISFSDERPSANAALVRHLQNRKQASVSSANSR